MSGYSLSFILEFVWSVISTSDFWAMTIRMTTPVLFAALGSCIASKAGIFNMSIEGLINSTAFISVLADGVVRKMAMGGKKKADFVDLVGSTYATKKGLQQPWWTFCICIQPQQGQQNEDCFRRRGSQQ